MNIGARLQAARERRGLSIADVAAATKIQPRYIAAIEQNDYRTLPRRPYGRGFVRAYASEVGENPDHAVRDFFAQFAPPPAPVPVTTPAPPERRFNIPVEGLRRAAPGALLLCLVVALVATAMLRKTPGRESPPPQSIGTAGDATPGLTGTMGSVPAPPPTPAGGQAAAQPEAPAAPVAVDLDAIGRAWVTANVDGARALYRTMQPGEHESLRGRETISVRVGDAGAVRWRVNGRAAQTMGRSGEVKSMRVVPE